MMESLEDILERSAKIAEREGARALCERARTLRDTVLDWRECAPSADERDDITRKILGLHVTLSRLMRGERA